MAKVAAAGAAHDLGAGHAVALVRSELDRVSDGRFGEARPPGTRVELGRTVEQDRPATGAAVTAIFVIVDICP